MVFARNDRKGGAKNRLAFDPIRHVAVEDQGQIDVESLNCFNMAVRHQINEVHAHEGGLDLKLLCQFWHEKLGEKIASGNLETFRR